MKNTLNLKKYIFLNGKDQEVEVIWTTPQIRAFNISYCNHLKRMLGRHSIGGGGEISIKNSIYWLIWNLEYLGKPRLAEAMYLFAVRKGFIDGI